MLTNAAGAKVVVLCGAGMSTDAGAAAGPPPDLARTVGLSALVPAPVLAYVCVRVCVSLSLFPSLRPWVHVCVHLCLCAQAFQTLGRRTACMPAWRTCRPAQPCRVPRRSFRSTTFGHVCAHASPCIRVGLCLCVSVLM
jgi:hypothetical protein